MGYFLRGCLLRVHMVSSCLHGFPLQYPYMLKFVVFYLTWAPFWVSPYATEPGQKEVHKKKDEAEGFEDENVVSLFFIL